MKEWKRLRELIHEADVIVEIADARDVDGTRLPLAERWSGSKRLLVVVNKCDLADAEPPKHGIKTSAKKADEKERRRIIRCILAKSSSRPVKALFIGYPNVGKSSVINMLAKRRAAKVSSVAGTTRNVQWIRINDALMVTDYRGVYPKAEKKEDLVRKGAVKIEHAEGYAYKFAEKALKSEKLRKWLEKKFDIDFSDAEDAEQVLSMIAERRKLYIKGGELNLEEAARMLLRSMKDAPEI